MKISTRNLQSSAAAHNVISLLGVARPTPFTVVLHWSFLTAACFFEIYLSLVQITLMEAAVTVRVQYIWLLAMFWWCVDCSSSKFCNSCESGLKCAFLLEVWCVNPVFFLVKVLSSCWISRYWASEANPRDSRTKIVAVNDRRTATPGTNDGTVWNMVI